LVGVIKSFAQLAFKIIRIACFCYLGLYVVYLGLGLAYVLYLSHTHRILQAGFDALPLGSTRAEVVTVIGDEYRTMPGENFFYAPGKRAEVVLVYSGNVLHQWGFCFDEHDRLVQKWYD
jgi:hypothetical protein